MAFMAADSWTTYRTRFLVKAKQLTTSLTFLDALGRQHSGGNGDYLVAFSDGVLRIVSREFFEDVYVPMLDEQRPARPDFGLQKSVNLLQHRGQLHALGAAQRPS